ncbi:MAG: thiol:disulfide interchange protein DsbA/DsbL [Burkholderiales bacterium]|nr:thiol:disulfide interchange protein DsbA/DsbL [Burkholderiales bacterium]
MMKRLVAVLAAVAAFASPAAAQTPQAGIDYTVLKEAQPTDSPGKVEVTEFFWFGCPHCYSLEPALERWVKKQPKDVEFKRVPAYFNRQWEVGARVYYALEATGDLDRLFKPLFDAIHREGLRSGDEKAIAEWLAKQGVDMQKYNAALKSFGVDAKVRRAGQLTQAYKLDGVPAVAVQGKYVVSASQAGGVDRMFDILDLLVAQSRKDLGKK